MDMQELKIDHGLVKSLASFVAMYCKIPPTEEELIEFIGKKLVDSKFVIGYEPIIILTCQLAHFCCFHSNRQ